MSRTSVSSTEGIKMPAKLRSLYQAQKPDIKISLNHPRRTYTTLDHLDGVVSVVAPNDTPFDEVDIEFVGTSRTYVERVTTAAAISGRSEAFHQFLKLTQPGLRRHYPEDGILRAGKTYRFPFVFVVPQQLLPKVCQHKTVSPAVRDAHLLLPPSFGDKEASPKAEVDDDMVPDMASIRYGIFTRISKNKEQNEETIKTTIVSTAKRLRIMPATPEQPPLDVDGDDLDYTMRKEKSVKKGMLKGKLGTLVMEAAQPPSLRMPARSGSETQSTAMATIMLRFDPADENTPPPRLGSLTNKLKVCTFYASTARVNYPKKCLSGVDMSQGLHTEQVSLSSRCMANAEWTKRDPSKPEDMDRRDSGFSVLSVNSGVTPAASSAYKGKTYYIARLLVPIALPKNKTFVPTFHSCLISRVYMLKLELGVQTAGIGGSLDLRLPLQISCEVPSGEPQRQVSVDAALEAEFDDEDSSDYFDPRTIRAPSEDFVGRSRIGSQAPVDDAPPGYSFFSGTQAGQRGVPVH